MVEVLIDPFLANPGQQLSTAFLTKMHPDQQGLGSLGEETREMRAKQR